MAYVSLNNRLRNDDILRVTHSKVFPSSRKRIQLLRQVVFGIQFLKM